MKCARRRRGKRAGAEGRCGKGCPVEPGKIRWDENAGLQRDAIRSQVTKRANEKEAESIQQSKELTAKTERFSAIAGAKNLARRNQELNGPSRARKSMP